MSILEKFQHIKDSGTRGFAVLVDPDKYTSDELMDLVNVINKSKVDFIFYGGSLMTSDRFESSLKLLKSTTDLPLVIFPGSNIQIDGNADAILFLSLISGRNPEYLIGQHIVAAPYIKQSGIEALPTGYMLIDSGKMTTANYVSQTIPIPSHKPEIAAATAMAGELLGHKLIYLDGGSGAEKEINSKLISQVRKSVELPLIVGGGIDSPEKAELAWNAGADVVVVGNAIEENLELLKDISSVAIH